MKPYPVIRIENHIVNWRRRAQADGRPAAAAQARLFGAWATPPVESASAINHPFDSTLPHFSRTMCSTDEKPVPVPAVRDESTR